VRKSGNRFSARNDVATKNYSGPREAGCARAAAAEAIA
jgi:hypothetical protein